MGMALLDLSGEYKVSMGKPAQSVTHAERRSIFNFIFSLENSTLGKGHVELCLTKVDPTYCSALPLLVK
jgi:hypothetical protein